MVAHADTTATLPPLTAEDKHRLRRYFALHQSLEALATDLAHSAPCTQSSALPTDEFDLATWLTSETIAPHITFHKANRDNADKQLAIETLKSVITSAANPTEQRRAATTLLRALSNQLNRTKHNAPPPSEPSGARGGRPSSSTSTHSLPQSDPPPPTIQQIIADSEFSTPQDCPVPGPEQTPEDIVSIALRAIQHPDTPTTDAGPITLYNLKGYTQSRTLESLERFKRNALKNWIGDLWSFTSASEPTPMTWAHGDGTTFVTVTLQSGITRTIKFTVRKATFGPFASCWLLNHILCEFLPQTNSS